MDASHGSGTIRERAASRPGPSAQQSGPPDRPAPLVEARGLAKRFGDFALGGVSFTVAPGRVVGFVGRNGAGKSTTIKALLGLVRLDGGEARVLGVPCGELSRTSAGAAAKERVGVVLDTNAIPGHLRVNQVGTLMRHAFDSWDEGAYEGCLRSFGLTEPRKLVKDLSRGMGMKLQLACALAHHPRLLVLDEATAGIDPMARDEVLDILRAFVNEEDADGNLTNGILLSSHITSDLDKIADTILCIDDGRVVFDVGRDEVTDQMGIARCRSADVGRVAAGVGGSADTGAGGRPRALRHDYGVDVLVPDRRAFAEACPDVPCDRMTIEDYMAFMLKGECL